MADELRERIVPKGGWNPYAHHPGFCASNCPHRITVTAYKSVVTDNGFACAVTGGHCRPGTQKECSP